MKVVTCLYAKYSGKLALPGSQRFMSLEEFVQMVSEAGVVDDNFGTREIGPMFNLAMMTQKNELDYDRHFNMTMPEFIEAIARVADKLSHLPDFNLDMPS